MNTYEIDGLMNEAGISYEQLPPSNKGLLSHYITATRIFGKGYLPDEGLVYDATNELMLPRIVGEYIVRDGLYVKGSYEDEYDVIGLPDDVIGATEYDISRVSRYDADASRYPRLTMGLDELPEPARESSIDYMDVWDDYDKQDATPAVKATAQNPEMDDEMKASAEAIRAYNLAKSKYTDCIITGDRDIRITYYNQMPWGYLHPDYSNAVDIDGVRYPSATNAIYASILFTALDKRIISNTGNALLASIKAEKLFVKHIETTMSQSVFDYYYKALAAGSKVDFRALQMTEKSIPFAAYIRKGGDMLAQEFDPQGLLRGDYSDVYVVKSDIDGYLFHNVFDYIDFKLRQLFGGKGESLQDVQNGYLEDRVSKTCKAVLESRVIDDVHFSRLLATLDTIEVDTRGYLSNYVDVIYTTELVNLRQQVLGRGIQSYDIVDASRSPSLGSWYEDRAREVITMLSVFEGQLAYKLDSFHVEQIIGHVYACTATDENILFQFYPESFYTLVQARWKKAFDRRADHTIIYEIWKFVCSLVFYVDQFSIPGVAGKMDFVKQCQSKVKRDYTPAEVSTSIDNATQVLDSLFSKLPEDLTPAKRLALLSGVFNPSAPAPSSLLKLKDRLSKERGKHTRSILYLFS